jgi:alanyl-tRNA synthetase
VIETLDLNDEVVHIVRSSIAAGTAVRGEIAWSRRFDHMQQHTGQHVLSAAFEQLTGNATVSFHIGAETSTIDLSREVTADDVARVEDEANRIVWEDRRVSIRFVTAEEAAALPLRKEPSRAGTLRLIDVDGFDLSACGARGPDRRHWHHRDLGWGARGASVTFVRQPPDRGPFGSVADVRCCRCFPTCRPVKR